MKFAALFLITGISAFSQTGPTFDVASVKHRAPETGTGAHYSGAVPRQADPTRINYPNVNLKYVLAAAYKLEPDQIGGPQWLDEERYDIVATLPARATPDQLPLMLKRLLADRFQLNAHVDSRPRTEYWLIVGNKGPKLQPAKDLDRAGFTEGPERTTLYGVPVRGFAAYLTSTIRRRVSDHTGIEGKFDIDLNVSAADLHSGNVFSAMEDLGLKLEAHSTPSDYLVIDKISKFPTGN